MQISNVFNDLMFNIPIYSFDIRTTIKIQKERLTNTKQIHILMFSYSEYSYQRLEFKYNNL